MPLRVQLFSHSVAADIPAPIPEAPASSIEFSIGYLAEGKDEVDRIMEQAMRAGATLTEAPHDRPMRNLFGLLQGHRWPPLGSHLESRSLNRA